MALEVGQKAPSFSLKDSNDTEFSLADLRGKNVVLYFYPKDDTPGCTIQAQDFTKYAKEFEKLDCLVIGVSKDDADSHCNFIQKYKLNLILLPDTQGELCENYGVIKQKSMFGKKYLGIDRSTFLIDKLGEIRQIWTSVKVKNHAEEVLDELKKLLKKS